MGRSSMTAHLSMDICHAVHSVIPILSLCVATKVKLAILTGFVEVQGRFLEDQAGTLPAAQIRNGDLAVRNSAVRDQAMTDAVYNTTAKLWQCCGTDMSGNPTCSDPLQEYFSAPAPEDLVSTYIIASASSNLPPWEFASSTASMNPASATVSPTTNTNATRSTTSNGLATASNAATNTPALPPRLSSNARAGIGVAAGTSGVLIGAAIVWLLLRRRRQKRRLAVGFSGGREFPRMPVVELGDEQKPETERREFATLPVAELQNNEKPRAELEGHLKVVVELATDQEGMAKRKVANKTPVAELANDEKPVSLRRKPGGTLIAELESDEKPRETPLTQKPVQKSSMQRLAEKPLPPDPPQEEEQEQEGDEDENENEEVETPVLVSPIEERR
ncbi:MAG: hypothetical protein Q9157_002906 [Trypethelium eluteriae]